MHGASSLQEIGARRRGRRRWLWLVLLCAVLILAAAYGGYRLSNTSRQTLVTAVVTRGDIEDVVTSTGKIQPRAYVDVGAQASGQLRRILVRVGDTVSAEQRLAEIDPQLQAAKVAADQAELARLQATLAEQEAMIEFNEAQLARQSRLLPTNATSQSSFDESRRDARTARAKADAIRAQIQQMQSTLQGDELTLGYTRIDAPMAGTVVSVDAREGQTLNATYSAPVIMRIADLATMTVWTQVSEADVTRLREGMDIYFTTLGHGDRRWRAKLRQILPAPQKPESSASAQPSTGVPVATTNNVVLYVALFDVDNAQGDLRPEMTAQVSFIVSAARDALLIPVSALQVSADGEPPSVQIEIGPQRYETRPVKLGVRTRFTAQVLEGVSEGERVVVGARKADAGSPLVGFRL